MPTHTFTNASGCDSVVTLHLTVGHANTGDTTTFACNSFSWYGTTYTSSATPTHTFTNASGCDSVVTLHLTINPNLSASVSIASDAINNIICAGTVVTFTATPTNGGSNPGYQWKVDGVNVGTNSNSYTTTSLTNGQVVTCVMTSNATPCVINSPATSNGIITTVNQITHNIATVSANESYVWHGTTYTTSGNYVYTYTNSSGCASADTLHLTINYGTFTSTTQVACNSYTWHGTTYITSGNYVYNYNNSYGSPSADTLHLRVNYSVARDTSIIACNSYTWSGTTYTTSGDRVKTFTTSTGCDSVVTLHLTITTAANLNAITVTGIKNVCTYIGTNIPVTYTANCYGATSFNWTLPLNSVLVSGQGTAVVSIKFLPGFASNASKQIRVVATSPCGGSPISIFYAAAQFPVTPTTIVASTSNVCPSIGTNIPITFTIPRVFEAGSNGVTASSYLWSAQNGTTNITHLNGVGVNDTSISVTFASNFTSSVITVQAMNQCGLSGSRTYFVNRNNPSAPGLISGPTNACEYLGDTGTDAVYSVPASATVNSYTWLLPAGATNVVGQGTNTISFRYPSTFTGGSISVTATNGCGTGLARSLVISRLSPATPGNIDVVNISSCPNRTYTYSISSMPGNSTSTEWTVPVGGTIINGQGTTSITVVYNSGVIDGNVFVRGINNCGVSSYKYTIVKLAPCPSIPGSNLNKGVNANEPSVMDVKVFPNPTTSMFNLQVKTVETKQVSIKILDVQGRLIKTMQINPNEKITLGAELKSGVYMLEVNDGSNRKVVRVVKY